MDEDDKQNLEAGADGMTAYLCSPDAVRPAIRNLPEQSQRKRPP